MPNVSTSTPDLMGLVQRQLTPDVIQRAASELGEDRDHTARALSTSVPSVLTALSDVARSPTGANHLEEMIAEARRSSGGRLSAELGASGATDAGTRLFDSELGSKSNSIADAVAGASGIRPSSAHKLLGGVTSATLLALGANKLGASTLRNASTEQRGEWVRRLPGPVAALFGGTGTVAETPVATRPAERVVTGPAIRTLPAQRRNWWFPLAILVVALLGYSLARGFRRPAVRTPASSEVTQTMPRGVPAERVPVTLPGGQTLMLARGSGLEQMANFLASREGGVPRKFAIAPLNFESNTATLTPESLSTVNDLAAVLAAYPKANVTLASYTDNAGTPDGNLALSTSRSEAIRSLLGDRGVDPARLNAVGFGQDHPIAPNNTAEGRAKNRRTEVVVTSK